ncbi:alkaline phosphatase family protein [Alteromonadaceae bacterium BrNp21-10]|nr:alkaline phosphatase family protein [Alteromonadaceae bacterium BrNp21-10]
MTLTTPPMIVIAIDGLDWQLLQQLADDGKMPFFQQLLDSGASGKISTPPPHSSAPVWSTLATGVLAVQHGICHDFEIREDGLTVQSISSQALKSEPFWHTAMAAGKSVRVAGWPATLPAKITTPVENGSCIVSDGVQIAQPGGETCWPLSPDTVAPLSTRENIQDLQVHPNDLNSEMVLPLLTAPCREAGLINVAAGLLAEVASIHNIGTMWAEQPDWDLITLRFNFLPTWLTSVQQLDLIPSEALMPWYRYLDLMIGRYMALAGRKAHLVLLSDHGLPPSQNSQADTLLGLKAAGSLIISGPDITPDQLLSNANGLDICPTILALMGIPVPSYLTGRALFSESAPITDPLASKTQSPSLSLAQLIKDPSTDNSALLWLQQHGYTPVNLTPLTTMVKKVKAETIAGWAAVKYATGNRNEAIEALQEALTLQPTNLRLRLLLADKLLETGRAEDCKALVDGLPSAAQEGDWPDIIASLIAFAEKDWVVAEQHLVRLSQSEQCPINTQGWLGHTKLAQEKWLEAKECYEASLSGQGELSAYYEGLGTAHMQLSDIQQALIAYSHAVALHPLNARLLISRAQVYEKMGELQLAQQDLWQALTIDPALIKVHGQLANLIANRNTQ